MPSAVRAVRGTELVQRLGALMIEALEEAGLPYYAEKDYFLSAPADPPGSAHMTQICLVSRHQKACPSEI